MLSRPKLYFDEDMSAILAARMRKAGWDVLTTHQARKRTSNDTEQLRFAAEQGRILITRNYADFLEIHTRCLESGQTHHGIIICFWRASAEAQGNNLLELLNRIDPDTWPGQLQFA